MRFSPRTLLTHKQIQGIKNIYLLKHRDGKVDKAEEMDETEAEAWKTVEEGGVREEEAKKEVQRVVPEVVPKKSFEFGEFE